MSLILPFKPFTFDEIKQTTGVSATQLDSWVGRVLELKHGCNAIGLDYMQMLGVFVGVKWLHENAPDYLADGVVYAISKMTEGLLRDEIKAGRTFPVSKEQMPSLPYAGIMTPAPDGPLGQRLRMDKLLAEFQFNLAKVFPNG